MPRNARVRSNTGIYHIILRGINRQNIFEDEEDCIKFLETIAVYKQKCGFQIYAYCLMGNHLHLLIKEGNEELGLVFRRIGASYVYWYNWKYKRSGHLFQDRYKSEAVEDENYLLTVIRYIHQNPLKAKIVEDIAKYRWSSYSEYIDGNKICDTDYVLKIFSENNLLALEKFKKFMYDKSEDKVLDIQDENFRLTDEEAKGIIKKICKTSNIAEFQKLDLSKKDKYIKVLRDSGISTRQLARLTGVSRSIIMKIT